MKQINFVYILFLLTFHLIFSAHAQNEESFPKEERSLHAALNRNQNNPASQALLIYLFQFGTGHELRPPTKEAQKDYDMLRYIYENDWQTLDWSQVKVRNFHLMTRASSQLRAPFKKSFPFYNFYPADWIKLFERRAQMNGERKLGAQELSFWLSLVPCLDGSGELIVDALSSHMRKNPGDWVRALSLAEKRMKSENLVPGGLCGDGNILSKAHAPEQLKIMIELISDGLDNNFKKLFREEVIRAKLEQREDLGEGFQVTLKSLVASLK